MPDDVNRGHYEQSVNAKKVSISHPHGFLDEGISLLSVHEAIADNSGSQGNSGSDSVSHAAPKSILTVM